MDVVLCSAVQCNGELRVLFAAVREWRRHGTSFVCISCPSCRSVVLCTMLDAVEAEKKQKCARTLHNLACDEGKGEEGSELKCEACSSLDWA